MAPCLNKLRGVGPAKMLTERNLIASNNLLLHEMWHFKDGGISDSRDRNFVDNLEYKGSLLVKHNTFEDVDSGYQVFSNLRKGSQNLHFSLLSLSRCFSYTESGI